MDKAQPLARLGDGELVTRCLQEEREAFGVLVDRYQRYLYALALARVGGDRETAKDVTQEAFLAAFRALGSLEQPDRFSSWLARIAVNLAVKARRRGDVREAVLAGAASSRDGAPQDTTGREVHRREQQRLARKLLRELPEDLRPIVTLRYMESMTLKAIGELLDMPLSTVQGKLLQARRLLQAAVRSLREEKENA